MIPALKSEDRRVGTSGHSAHSNELTLCLVKDLVSGNKVGQCDGLVVRWGLLPRLTA